MKKMIPLILGTCLMAFPIETLTAQSLLPAPQKVKWEKGKFRTDVPFVIESDNKASGELAVSAGWSLENKNAESVTSRRMRYVTMTGMPSAGNEEAYIACRYADLG